MAFKSGKYEFQQMTTDYAEKTVKMSVWRWYNEFILCCIIEYW